MIAQTPLRCFSYARCSTDKQDKSIARQNREMGQDAQRVNCQIVRRFDDEAVSGAKTHQRPGFLAMMEAARTEDIDAILVENSNRFGRFDSLEAGKWLQPLQERGIVLVSLTERTFDFNSFCCGKECRWLGRVGDCIKRTHPYPLGS